MSKIIIVRYPYDEYKVGDVVDFGDEVNASLVEFQRAVWANPPEVKEVKKVEKKELTESLEEVTTKKKRKKKKMLVNELGVKIEEKKEENKKELARQL